MQAHRMIRIVEKVRFYKNKEYTDLLAIQDTAKEVQNLKLKRNSGDRKFLWEVRALEKWQERFLGKI